MKPTILVDNTTYTLREVFDVNITVDYENDRWSEWHVLREFISNALDVVAGDKNLVQISEADGHIKIRDLGAGYPLAYAKRIGASSKKHGGNHIGQFGEGLKLALLTCVRKGLHAQLMSQDWLIVPRIAPDPEGLNVLVFDVYQTDQVLQGTLVTLQATPAVQSIIEHIDQYFLQFSSLEVLSGTYLDGILPKGEQARVYNKGVFIRDIDAMFSYGFSLTELNRDRDLIDESVLITAISAVWKNVHDLDLIRAYLEESERIAAVGTPSPFKEFALTIYPRWDIVEMWKQVFLYVYGEKAILCTDAKASIEARHLGYRSVQMEYNGRATLQYCGVKRDIDVVSSSDYEFDWAILEALNDAERARLDFLAKVADILELPSPSRVRVFERYAKSDAVLGLCNSSTKEIYLRREHLNDNPSDLVGTYIHEIIHMQSGYDDYSREFADSLTRVAGQTALALVQVFGITAKLKLTDRGFKLPRTCSFTADTMIGSIATIGNEIVIYLVDRVFRAKVDGVWLRPYCSQRDITYYKGDFYVNIPSTIRVALPTELLFRATWRTNTDAFVSPV